MGDRLDSVLEEIDILGSKAKQFHQGNVRIASLTIDLNLIEIIKKQHQLIVLLDHRLASLERLQKEG